MANTAQATKALPLYTRWIERCKRCRVLLPADELNHFGGDNMLCDECVPVVLPD